MASTLSSGSNVRILLLFLVSSFVSHYTCARSNTCRLETLVYLKETIQMAKGGPNIFRLTAQRLSMDSYSVEQGLDHLVAYEIDRFIHEDPKWMENELFSARSLVRLCKRVRRMKSNGYKIGDAECLKWAKEVQDCIENRWEDLLPRLSSDTASFEDLIKKFEERNIQ